jgi:hypothetical protein
MYDSTEKCSFFISVDYRMFIWKSVNLSAKNAKNFFTSNVAIIRAVS